MTKARRKSPAIKFGRAPAKNADERTTVGTSNRTATVIDELSAVQVDLNPSAFHIGSDQRPPLALLAVTMDELVAIFPLNTELEVGRDSNGSSAPKALLEVVSRWLDPA